VSNSLSLRAIAPVTELAVAYQWMKIIKAEMALFVPNSRLNRAFLHEGEPPSTLPSNKTTAHA